MVQDYNVRRMEAWSREQKGLIGRKDRKLAKLQGKRVQRVSNIVS